jgi:Trypsin
MTVKVRARRENAATRWGKTAAAALAVAGALALLAAGAVPARAVADGTPAKEGQYQFAVKLTMTGIPKPDGTTYNSGCSGALIAPQWVMTAGHCFHDVNRVPVSGAVPYQTTATIGRTDDSDTSGVVVDVVADYQSPAGDIVLARLASPVYGIRPLALATTAPAAGETVRIAGWGSLSDVDPAPATHLQTGQFTITAVSDTVVNLVGYKPQATTSACLYDSGAPYFTRPRHGRPRLVSVESNGPSCPDTGPETTSRVDTIASWAEQTMAAHQCDADDQTRCPEALSPPARQGEARFLHAGQNHGRGYVRQTVSAGSGGL